MGLVIWPLRGVGGHFPAGQAVDFRSGPLSLAMVKINLRHRHPVNKKEARSYADMLNQAYGLGLNFSPGEVEVAQGPGWECLMQENRILVLLVGDTLKGGRARLASGLEQVARAEGGVRGGEAGDEGEVSPHSGPCLTVRGVLTFRPTANWVEVDMGAVPYLSNGAHVMGPGVVAVAPGVRPGTPVWVRDERNRQPLAVGWALQDGAAMAGKEAKGKAVFNLQFVGDEIWLYGEPE